MPEVRREDEPLRVPSRIRHMIAGAEVASLVATFNQGALQPTGGSPFVSCNKFIPQTRPAT